MDVCRAMIDTCTMSCGTAIAVPLLLWGALLAAGEGRTFHVDAAQGSDACDGLAQERAWRSLVRVNRATLAPGDRVLFRRGGVWRGSLIPQSGTPGHDMVYGAYGSGAKPLLLGSASRNEPGDWIPAGPGLWATAPPVYRRGATIAPLKDAAWSLYTEGGAAASLTPLAPDAQGAGGFRLDCRRPGFAGNHIQVSTPGLSLGPVALCLLSAQWRATRPCTLGRAAILLPQPPWTTFASGTAEGDAVGEAWAERSFRFAVQRSAAGARLTFFLGGQLPADTILEGRFGALTEVQPDQAMPLAVDVGNVVFDDGQAVGVKKWSLAELVQDGDYWYDARQARVVLHAGSNPATRHRRIELALTRHIIDQGGRSCITYEGLALSLGAAHGIGGGSTSRISVRECDISWIGGGHQCNRADGQPVRYGNGIEFWSSASHCVVEGCRIWEIYDAALTNQGDGVNVQEDIAYRRNLIWNSEYSFEFWNRGSASRTRRIHFEHNTCVDAGCGWGHGQRPDPNGRHLMFYDNSASTEEVVVSGNIFSHARDSLLRLHGRDWTAALVMESNAWFQDRGAWLLWGQEALDAEHAPEFLRQRGFATRSFFTAPRFAAAGERDYRLAADSPLRAAAGDTLPGACP